VLSHVLRGRVHLPLLQMIYRRVSLHVAQVLEAFATDVAPEFRRSSTRVCGIHLWTIDSIVFMN
jgi:hypothetical protein